MSTEEQLRGFGPFSEFDINSLREKLDAKNIAYEVRVSEELLEAFAARRTETTYPESRQFTGTESALFIFINEKDIAPVALEIEKMGISLTAGTGDELDDVESEEPIAQTRTIQPEGFDKMGALILFIVAAVAIFILYKAGIENG